MESNKESYNNFRVAWKIARRMAFSRFVNDCSLAFNEFSDGKIKKWQCCDSKFDNITEIQRHVAAQHSEQIDKAAQQLLVSESENAHQLNIKEIKSGLQKCQKTGSSRDASEDSDDLPVCFNENEHFPWLPDVSHVDLTDSSQNDRVLLFYHYRDIKNTSHVKVWQETLCTRLHLTGKIRVSCEGLNATVGGTWRATQIYKEAVMKHPLFNTMSSEDFKESPGGASVFPGGLTVGVYPEACPMGVSPQSVSHRDTGSHLSPAEFHEVLEKYHSGEEDIKSNSVFVDCRNFYEWKIGNFKGAVTPDIRKFSYWPEYVDTNQDFFKDKNVYMYCTGGIRCERGSAYLKKKDVCKGVYQLKGGIHKYIEEFPDGYFRGKLFVFDDRYSIPANSDIISMCVYCEEPWDNYQPCSSSHCHQLVLSCRKCRSQDLTTCCKTCAQNAQQGSSMEQCDCTKHRVRIPVENPS